MHLSTIANIIQGTLQGADAEISSISINTRDLNPGQLFIALKGDQFDGHDFLQTACDKGAACVIVAADVTLSIPTIKVMNTRIALGQLARHFREQHQLPVVAVTGSCGKTTTKTMLTSILSQLGPTLSPQSSFNNDVGVPLTLLDLTPAHQYAVIEMGANHSGEIAYLSDIAQQDVSIITNVAPAHLLGFGSIEGVAKAKGEIYEALSPKGIAIVNQDDAFASQWLANMQAKRVITFGIKSQSDVQAVNVSLDDEGHPQFDIVTPLGSIKINLPVLGIHNVMNALAAAAAAYALGATLSAIQEGLSRATAVSKRLVRYKGLHGSQVIDDTYNANPLSVSAALEILTHGVGEKIFVFGDMAELGPQEETLHKEVGERARQLGINKLFACGKLSQLTVTAFGQDGFYFKDQASLVCALKPLLHKGAVVLVKGSRSAHMEHVVQALISEN